MATAKPQVIIRMGSHSEKEYLKKTIKFFDGLILGANLVEATPGATASLLIKFGGRKLAIPFYVDPMTYAFGSYVDQGRLRTDLDWIKSDQKSKKGTVRRFKRSYNKLADEFGGPVADAVAHGAAIKPSDLEDKARASRFCKSIVDYQTSRLARVFREDPEYEDFAADLPTPTAVFAPYFYIEPSNHDAWTRINLHLATLTTAMDPGLPVHAVILADVEFLRKPEFLNGLAKNLPRTGVTGVWLWFSNLVEHTAETLVLDSFRSLISNISDSGLKVFNMHGGYFSLVLSKYGLAGTSHGVGYGEQKDVMPVIGQSTPTVRYHLPGIHKRVGVPDIQRCFEPLGIETPADFHEHVCDCVICKGVVNESIDDFEAFGDMRFSTPTSRRQAQTPAAAKRCRFHFLMSRLRERDEVSKVKLSEIRAQLGAAEKTWGRFPSLQDTCRHLGRWQKALA